MTSTNKKGRLMVYCQNCNKYYIMNDEQFNWTCPGCGALMLCMRCTRCGYKWNVRKTGKLPKICANEKCKSPYWNRERILNRKGKLVPYDEKD